MVLTALVILSVVRQFFLGNYHNMFLGIFNIDPFYGSTVSGQETERHNTTGTGDSHSDFIFSAEILGEINAFYVKNPHLGYHLHTTNGFSDGCHRICTDRSFLTAVTGFPLKCHRIL